MIHSFTKGRYDGWHVPLVYVLTTNKQQETYEEVFEVLKRLEPTRNPTDITVDFEMAVMNAIRKHFELAEIHGCYFHFGQNIWRKVQEVGLQSEYAKNADFALQIRLLIALAYVPPESVFESYEELIDTEFYAEDTVSKHSEAIKALLAYFQNTYVYRVSRKGTQEKAMYEPSIWNVHSVTTAGSPRTNNQVEGWHNKIAKACGTTHKDIFKFLIGLRKEQCDTEHTISRVGAGNVPAARKPQYIASEKKILKIVNKFNNDVFDGNYLPFLTSIAHQTSM